MTTATAITPKVGMRFLHSRVLNVKYEPQLYRVIKITGGDAFYRAQHADSSLWGCVQYCPVEQFHRWCKEVVR